MKQADRGSLMLADISGYTKYVAGVELEHSQDILADLIGAVVAQMGTVLLLAKLEGDAIFCYSTDTASANEGVPADSAAAHGGHFDGQALLAMVESSYFAFADRLDRIRQHTTCDCDACRLIPALNLKLLGHHGAYLVHNVAGNTELLGRDVILAHRLLKNSVTDRTGLRGYALFTRACIDRYGLEPASVGMVEHRETYDDVGEIEGYVYDLEARWKQEQERHRVYVEKDETVMVFELELPASPPVVWDYITSPRKRAQWQADVRRVDEHNPRGIRGVGTINHCVHGSYTVEEEIVDWKPFRYVTMRSTGPFGTITDTWELSPLPDGSTLVSARFKPPEGMSVSDVPPETAAGLQEMMRLSEENLRHLISTQEPAVATTTQPSA